MSSLSSIMKKQRANNVSDVKIRETKADVDSPQELIPDDLEPPKLIRQSAYVAEKPDRPKNLLFVSDHKLIPSIKAQLMDYKNIYPYERDLFTNRTCEQLLNDHDCQSVWIDITSKHGRTWLEKSLINNDSYTVVCVYSGDKNQKWITTDLKDHYKMLVKITELEKVKSLTYDELLDGIGSLSIHPPIQKWLSMCGITKGRIKKNRNSR